MPSGRTDRVSPASFSLPQIVLHWSIAALVLWQLFVSEGPPDAERLARSGQVADSVRQFLASSHIWVGFAILALVVVRIGFRFAYGAPKPTEEGRFAGIAARTVHAAFYILLIAMPLTGIAGTYFGLPTGEIHEFGKPVFLVLIAAHVGAALWHRFVRHDGVMRRMIVPARPRGLGAPG